MSDSLVVPPEWETQVGNLAKRFGVSPTVALQAMQQSKGHGGKAARMLRLNTPAPQAVLLDAVEQDPLIRVHTPEPEPELEPKLEPESPPPPFVEPITSPHKSAMQTAMVDTLAALETATAELRALNQNCGGEESDGAVKRGISILVQLETVVQTHRAQLADLQDGRQELVALPVPSFSELWDALRELKDLSEESPDQTEFFTHTMRDIWVTIGELVSKEDTQEDAKTDFGREWRDADPDLLLATAQGLQTEGLWPAAVVVYSHLIHVAETEDNHPLQSSRQLYHNGRGMCYSRMGDAAAAASDIDTAGALVSSRVMQ